jgi:hypothetical protein
VCLQTTLLSVRVASLAVDSTTTSKAPSRIADSNFKCFSALPDLFLVTCIVPVSVTHTAQSLQLSKLTCPATVIDESVTVHPTIAATFSDCLKKQVEWKRPLLEDLECISGKNRLHEILCSGGSIKFTLASDGGASPEMISAPLAENSSQLIARHCGNAKGRTHIWSATSRLISSRVTQVHLSTALFTSVCSVFEHQCQPKRHTRLLLL